MKIAQIAVGRFIMKVNDDIEWVVSWEQFDQMSSSRLDTGSSPDGIPYSFWNNCPPEWKRQIYNVYLHLLGGGAPDVDFNVSRIAFPPKGKEIDDTRQLIRTPNKTRPITLSNTDSKHISSCICAPLDKVAQSIGNHQKGGISGRQMGEHILNLEAKLIQFVRTNCLLGGIIAMDQEAAFPSISRRYMLWVLRMMGIPKKIRNVLTSLYVNCSGRISLAGMLFGSIAIESGVKQGDPSSMVIFILAYDPILRWISSLLSPMSSEIFGMCDDLAIATEEDIGESKDEIQRRIGSYLPNSDSSP